MFGILKLKIIDIINIVICIAITYVIYLMFFTTSSLPEWTELFLILGFPTLLAMISMQSNSEEQEKWLCQFIIQALVVTMEVLLQAFVPEQIKWIKLTKVPLLLFCVHPVTAESSKIFAKNVLGIVFKVMPLTDSIFDILQ